MSLHEDQLAYESFLAYCRTIGVDPPSFETWLQASDKMQGFHDTPSSIIGYVK